MSRTALQPYLMFQGDARDAMQFYQRVLGGSLRVQTFGEVSGPGMPPPPPELADKVMHAQLEAEGVVIMASDPPPGSSVKFGDNVNLCLVGSDADRLTRAFRELSAGGRVTMPLEQQFWGDTFGSFVDRFGVCWMVNIESAEQRDPVDAAAS